MRKIDLIKQRSALSGVAFENVQGFSEIFKSVLWRKRLFRKSFAEEDPESLDLFECLNRIRYA